MIIKLFNSAKEELPEFKSLDEGVEYIKEYLLHLSESLDNHEIYLEKRWMEVRDDIQFQEKILHIFRSGGKYLRILEGDIVEGEWEISIGGLIIRHSGSHELYEKVFLNEHYFILAKHGDHSAKGLRKKYFFMAEENLAVKMEWNELLDNIFSEYKNNVKYILLLIVVFIIFIAVIVFSFK